MATIRKMGKKWQAVIRIKKRQLSKSFEKKSDAVKWSAKVEYEIEQGVFNNSDRLNSLKVSELLWLYYEKTKHQTKWSERLKYEILNLCKFPITKLFMSELTTLRVAEFRDDRLLHGKSPSTVKKYLSLLSRAINKAKREFDLPILYNPVALVEKPKEPIGRSRILTNHELEVLLNYASKSYLYYLKDIIVVAIDTLCRQGELLRLQRTDVDFTKATIYIREAKNGHPRKIGASPRVLSVLRSLPTTVDGRFFPVKSRSSFASAFKKAVKSSGVIDFTFHDLRHMGASILAEKGWSAVEISAQGGWRDVRMLSRYTHIQGEYLAKKLKN